MKQWLQLAAGLVLCVSLAHTAWADVVISGTRVVYPGQAREVTDNMVTAASLAVAEFAASIEGPPSLVPPVAASATVARAVARAVARQAVRDGAAPEASDEAIEEAIVATAWTPRYTDLIAPRADT